jgi:hypothetical protein
MMRILSSAAVGMIGMLLATTAFAQSGPVGTSCGPDIAKLCAGLQHDGSVRICLEQNYDKVSAACQGALDTTGGGRGNQSRGTVSGPVATSCRADLSQFCANEPHNGPARVCLERNYDKLSATCKSALDTTGGGMGKGLGIRRGQ